jgi:hypothetical protein
MGKNQFIENLQFRFFFLELRITCVMRVLVVVTVLSLCGLAFAGLSQPGTDYSSYEGQENGTSCAYANECADVKGRCKGFDLFQAM